MTFSLFQAKLTKGCITEVFVATVLLMTFGIALNDFGVAAVNGIRTPSVTSGESTNYSVPVEVKRKGEIIQRGELNVVASSFVEI